MSTRTKGRKMELRTRDALIKQGYAVQVAPMPSKWSTQNDMFGLWDVVAVNGTEVRFIQVKTNRKVYGKQKAKYAAFNCPPFCTKEIWSWYDRVKEPLIVILTS
jgi:hypothetical protein